MTGREHAVAMAIANRVDRLVSRKLIAAVRVMQPKPHEEPAANVGPWRPRRELLALHLTSAIFEEAVAFTACRAPCNGERSVGLTRRRRRDQGEASTLGCG